MQDQTDKTLATRVFTKAALTLQMFVPKNDAVEKMSDTLYVMLYFDGTNSDKTEIKVEFRKTATTSDDYVYTSRWQENGKIEGRPLFLVENMSNSDSLPRYYVLNASLKGYFIAYIL